MATRRKTYRPLRVAIHKAILDRTIEAIGSVGLSKRVDHAVHWLGRLSNRSTQRGKLETPKFVPVNAVLHRAVFHTQSDYTAMIKALVDSGVIQKGKDAIRGKSSTEYRPHPDLMSGPTVLHEITGRTAQTLRTLDFKNNDRLASVRRCPEAVLANQIATFRKIVVMPGTELLLHEDDPTGQKLGARKLNLIELAEMTDASLMPDEELCVENRFGRIDSPLTRLWKGFRPFLRLNGEPLVSIDIKNSQPFFIGRLLDRIIKAFDWAAITPLVTLQRLILDSRHAKMMEDLKATGDDSEVLRVFMQCYVAKWKPEISDKAKSEYKRYVDEAASGNLYEQIVLDKHKKVTQGRRNEAKKAIIRSLYGKSRRSRYWKSFQKLYPVLSDMIYYLKRARVVEASKGYRRYAAFSRLLQIIEGKYVFQEVCPALQEAGIEFLTIHDCIVVKESQQDQAYAVIVAAFAKHNLHPKLAIEPFSKYNKNMDNSAIVVEEICNTTNGEDYKIIPLHQTPATKGDSNGTATRRLRRDRREADHFHDVPSKGCGETRSRTGESHELLGQCHDPQDRGGSLHSEPSDGDHPGIGDHGSEPVIPPLTKAVG